MNICYFTISINFTIYQAIITKITNSYKYRNNQSSYISVYAISILYLQTEPIK